MPRAPELALVWHLHAPGLQGWLLLGVERCFSYTSVFYSRPLVFGDTESKGNNHIFSVQGLVTVSWDHVFVLYSFTKNMNPSSPWKESRFSSLFLFFSLFCRVSWHDVIWSDHLWRFSWGGAGRDHGDHLFMLENWPGLPMPCCLFCPTGSSVQHLFHHRSRRLWPGLALPRGGRSDVHPGICWVHWSSARKHFPSQVCKYHTPLTHREPDPHLTSGGHSVEAGVSRNQRHWQDCGLSNASLLGEHFRCPPPPSSTHVPAC